MSDYPKPRPSPINQPHLDAWAERGELLIQRCASCASVFHYPRPFCPRCFAPEPEWIAASGRGEVVLATRIHRPNHPSFFDEAPIVLAEIRLPEGPTLIARIVGDDREQTAEGSAVALVNGEERRRYPLPTYRLAK